MASAIPGSKSWAGRERVDAHEGSLVSVSRQFIFDTDRDEAVDAINSIALGRGWCNVVPRVADEVPDISVKFTGLWVSHGATEATFVTFGERKGVIKPSSLGILHTRGRLGKERITLMLAGAPFVIRQDHSNRGVLLDVPLDTPAAQVLEVMCSMTETLCDYDMTGGWRFDLYTRAVSP
ncbi:MAG TPA: hypothetical protein VG246_06205 [Acidimicrobiales bacterium]|nr:hypothetical protein [Acidimicrobiales bacterium]